MSSSASSILDFGNESTKGIRRWGSKTHTPSSNVSTPLVDRTNTTRARSSFSASTADSTPYAGGMTTFLPEMQSTPPMPTFQKPNMETPTPLRRGRGDDETTPSRTQAGRRSVMHNDELGIDRISGSASLMRPKGAYATTPLADRIGETPNLPRGWSQQLDRAICILDASDYTLPAIVAKVRRVFPELNGTLTPAMIDKRLRQLDQIPELDYWAIGLAKNEKQQRREKAKASEVESKRLHSNTASPEAGRGQAESSRAARPRTEHISHIEPGADERPTTPPATQERNLVTRNFLTGFRSEFL